MRGLPPREWEGAGMILPPIGTGVGGYGAGSGSEPSSSDSEYRVFWDFLDHGATLVALGFDSCFRFPSFGTDVMRQRSRGCRLATE